MAAKNDMHVAVIGSGIIGACCALFLAREGIRVTIIEPETPGGRHSASFGNGAFISPASIIPMSTPGLWRLIPRYLFDRKGPLSIRIANLPCLLPWLARFVLAGATPERVRKTAGILNSLLADGPARHAALAGICGCPNLIRQDGLLYVFNDYANFEEESFAWQLRRENGLTWKELHGAELHRFEPALSQSINFGILLEGGAHCVDPAAYVGSIVAAAEKLGARRVCGYAIGFARNGRQLAAVRTNKGPVECSHCVIASGIDSKALAQAAGDRVPLEAERGYHVEIMQPGITLRIPIMPYDGKMANTMTANGLRASGQVELASRQAEPDWRRADILLHHLERTYPQLPRNISRDRLHLWQGNRPSTPDGIPVIGRSSCIDGIVYAFGHGHIGLNAGPITGELVTAIIEDREANIDIRPLSAQRFRRYMRVQPHQGAWPNKVSDGAHVV